MVDILYLEKRIFIFNMYYLFLDESGDLGFDFVQKKPSNFFVATILLVKGNESLKKCKIAVRRTIRNKLNTGGKRKRLVSELKGSGTTLEIKKYLYKQLIGADISVYCLVLNKRRVFND